MPDLYLIANDELPKGIRGSYSRYSLGILDQSNLLRIEDRLFKGGQTVGIHQNSGCIVVPNVTDTTMDEIIVLSEFGLALLTAAGHLSFRFAALFSGATCVQAKVLPEQYTKAPVFVETVNGKAAAQWLSRCILSRANLKDHLHITARRYVNYATANDEADGLLDLCISLESILGSQSEVSFRFGISLTKVCKKNGTEAREAADLLSSLYDIRSKLAHGDPDAAKKIKKIEPQLPELRELAKRILTIYILYTSEHSRDEWKEFLKAALFV